MRVHVLSDLHIEFGPFELPAVDADLLILAGDTHTKLNGMRWARTAAPEIPVLYLLGNHEYYGAKLPRLVEKLKEEAEGSNVQILEEDSVEIGGFRFFGATLWTDMALQGDPYAGSIEAMQMNDYKKVRQSPSYRKLRPADTRSHHLSTLISLKAFAAAGDPNRSVVITHHAPSARSLPEKRRSELISCAYASHLDELVEELDPLLWIHRHIHHSQDYMIGRTRVIANPRAYVDEPNPSFDPRLVIDLNREQQSRTEQGEVSFPQNSGDGSRRR